MTGLKFFSKLFVVLLVFATTGVRANEEALSNYVNNLTTQFLSVAKDSSLSESAKTAKVRNMLNTNLDFDWMGKFSLGRYRRNASPEQISSFINVYRDYLTKTYSEAVRAYKGEKIEVKGVKKISDKQEFVVKTLIIKNAQEPLVVDYLVREFVNGGKVSYKVFDVVTENVSMINSQQAEFGGILSSGGIDKLKSDLAKKTLN